MKKLFTIMMVVAVVLTFGVAAYAANTVQVTLTSPAITKSGCERVGSVTFSFDAGTVLNVGDWWYMDLPSGVSICRDSINYLITGGNASTVTNASTINAAIFGNAADSLATMAPGVTGPITVAGSNTTVGGANVAILVSGPKNGRRVTLTVIGDAVGGNIAVGNTNPTDNMKIKILDGAQDNFSGGAASGIVLDSNANGIYNDNAATDVITAAVPAPQNTLCVDAQQMAGDLMFVSFDSLNSKFTFTGDSQIAHTAAANTITLAACKGVTSGNVLIGQQSSCAVDYETATGYCTKDTFATQSMLWGATGGNKFLIQGAGTFGQAGDMYKLYVYSDTPGVYFTGNPTLTGYTPTQTPCSSAYNGGAAIAATWTPVNEGGTLNATMPAPGVCTVATAKRVRELRSSAFGGINTYNVIEVGTPTMTYDTSVVGAGTEVKIRLSLQKQPCGEIFTATRTIGSFVTTCPTAASTTTLLFPFFPPMDGSIPGWWGGFVIVNGGTTAGTAVLTFTEADGDTATLTTPSIAAGGMWNAGDFATLLTSVTPGSGNAGTFGDKNFSVSAVCNFSMGAGFAFTGNGTEGTGYIAYTNGGWQ